MLLASGLYTLGVGSPSEAVAFLKASPLASAPNRHVLDDDRNEEDRVLYQIGGSSVIQD